MVNEKFPLFKNAGVLPAYARLLATGAVVVALAACANQPVVGTDQLDAADQSLPRQARVPGDVQVGSPGIGKGRVNTVKVPTSLARPSARYRTIGPSVDVSIPPWEIPSVGKGKKKFPSWAPVEATTERSDEYAAQIQAWTGTSATFVSTDFDDNGTETSGFRFIPSDTHGAAGPDHVVSVVNVSVAFHEKDGTLLFRDSLKDFFASVTPANFTFDPKVLYDQYEDRWVIVTLEKVDAPDPETSRILVAVSDDSNPEGTWYIAAIDGKVNIGGTDRWADYPGFAIDEEAIYITANMFSWAGGFGGVRLWVLDKGIETAGFYESGTLSAAIYDPYSGAGNATTTQPAHTFGTMPAGTGTFLVSYSGLSNGVSEFFQVVRIDDPLGTPTFVQGYLSVGDIDNTATALSDMPQLGTGTLIESNDRRALDAVWRDDSLWFTATIDPPTGADSGQATALWAKIDTSNLSALSVADFGSIGGEDLGTGTYTTFPSIAVNAAGDAVVGFTASNSGMYAGAYFATRNAGDAAGTMGASVPVKVGTDYYVRAFGGARNRWGDYSAAVVDPVDGCFWLHNKWADTRGTQINGEEGRWGTAFAKTCGTVDDACNATLNVAANTWTMFSLPCRIVTANTVVEVFSGLSAADYSDDVNPTGTWAVFRRNRADGTYQKLDKTDPLLIGEGFWVFSTSATQVNLAGYQIDRADIPVLGSPGGTFNLLGNNQNLSVSWAAVQVIDGADVKGLGDYDQEMSRTMYKWNGSAYQAFDGNAATGTEGSLDPFDAFWVEGLNDVSLRIPQGAAPAPSVGMAMTAAAPDDEQAGPESRRGNPRGPEKGRDWYIRLTASSGQLSDPGNVFGQVKGATDGPDVHDLPELAPQGARYLTILFDELPEPEVGWGYTTDFRTPTTRPKGEWPFVVRGSVGDQAVTLSWQGDEAAFDNAWLVDDDTGERMRVESGGEYAFELIEGERLFRFVIR